MNGGRLVGGGGEVFAQGRAERHLVTVLDGNGVDELREKFRIRVVQQFGEGVFFRLQLIDGGAGLGRRPLELRSVFLGFDALRFGRLRGCSGRSQNLFRFRGRLFRR